MNKIKGFKLKAENRRGFTLIELLVSIAIVGILVGIAAFALQGGQRAGRDGRRKSDLEQVSSALELYRSVCQRYPGSLSWGSALVGTGTVPCSGSFMNQVPQDISAPSRTYSYTYNAASNTYNLCAALEEEPVPPVVMSNYNCGSCGAAACNYVVINP